MSQAKKVIYVSALAVFLTLLAPFFGAPVVRSLRKAFPAWISFSVGLFAVLCLVLAKQAAMASMIASLWVLVLCYCHFETKNRHVLGVFIISCLMSTLLLVASPFFSDLLITLKAATESKQSLLSWVGPITEEKMISHLFGFLFSMNMIFLATALVFSKRVSELLGLKSSRSASTPNLLQFRLPDFVIWPFLICLLMAFLNDSAQIVQIVAFNGLYIFGTLFFFQGLAVIEYSFSHFKAGFFSRTFTYFLILTYLMFSVVGIGLIDYWFNFRERLKNYKLKKIAGSQ